MWIFKVLFQCEIICLQEMLALVATTSAMYHVWTWSTGHNVVNAASPKM